VTTVLKKAALLGMFVLLAATMLWARPALAAENGPIYFISNGATGDIYSVDPTVANAEAKPVIVDTSNAADFDVSRDGQALVYNPPCSLDGCVAGAAALYKVPLADGDPYYAATPVEIANLSSSAKDITSPQFSPDGQTIYFAGKHVLDSDDDTYAIYSVPTDGGEATKIPIDEVNTDQFHTFALSHDGSKFAMGGQGGVFTVAVGGGGPTKITSVPCQSESHPSFSPDDQTIVYDAKIWSADNCTGTPRQTIYTTPANSDGTSAGTPLFPGDATDAYTRYQNGKYFPTYSPDGKSIAFSYWPVTDTDHVAIVPAGGGSITDLSAATCGMCRALWVEKSAPDTPEDPPPAPPDTAMTSASVGSLTNSTTANFGFSASENDATFECKLDGGAFEDCTSPKGYPALGEGSHTFEVRAKNPAGTDETPASHTWTVDATAPKVSATTPASGATGVARKTDLTADFSEKMDPNSVNTSTFKLYKCSSTTSTTCTTQITNVTVAPSTDGLKATLNPYGTSSTLLASTTKYKAVVTTGAKDVAGNALDQDPSASGNQQKAWYFTTGRT
jgi:Tol biopolymer transport system component